MFRHSLDNIRKLIMAVIGFTIILIGIALLVLPGPGLLVILFGLVILAGEFVWAKKLLDKFKGRADKVRKEAKRIMELI